MGGVEVGAPGTVFEGEGRARLTGGPGCGEVFPSIDGRAGSRCESGAVPPLSPGSDPQGRHYRAAVGRLREAPIREPGNCSRRSFVPGRGYPEEGSPDDAVIWHRAAL